MIQLDISRIKNNLGEEQHLVLDFQMQPVKGEYEEIYFSNPLRMDLLLTNDDGLLKLKGRFQGNILIACSRCLETFDLPVEDEIDEIYYNKYQQNAKSNEEWIPFAGGDVLDITPEVIKALISSLPMKLICRHDCLGLCQKCGINLNISSCDCLRSEIDSRMLILKNLFEEK